ncbi:vicilin-like seed storage protein At2g18540 [Nilaparvata lugens]|uniref:vicilin-like seed storage protein At2g18540 n=1 Tax=Nilaparvata lugens TaxID=108931 RepID=UPI00193E904A|nr:vicilin-like seed storage protein At2g18540 [Nilaparvata lugens]
MEPMEPLNQSIQEVIDQQFSSVQATEEVEQRPLIQDDNSIIMEHELPSTSSAIIHSTPSRTEVSSFAQLEKKAIDSSTVPSPFKRALSWPDPIAKIVKKRQREAAPSVVASADYKNYLKRKMEKKEEEEEKKRERASERARKKAEKEQIKSQREAEKQKKKNEGQHKKKTTRTKRSIFVTSSEEEDIWEAQDYSDGDGGEGGSGMNKKRTQMKKPEKGLEKSYEETGKEKKKVTNQQKKKTTRAKKSMFKEFSSEEEANPIWEPQDENREGEILRKRKKNNQSTMGNSKSKIELNL